MNPPYPSTRKRNLISHFIGVPIDRKTSAVCIVLWQSKLFKNLITLAITSDRLPHGDYPDQIGNIQSAIDTGANVIRSGYWHLGPKTSIKIPIETSMRLVASKLYCDDSVVRDRLPADESIIPTLGAAGMDYVKDYISFLDTGSPDELPFQQFREVMGLHLKTYPIGIDAG